MFLRESYKKIHFHIPLNVIRSECDAWNSCSRFATSLRGNADIEKGTAEQKRTWVFDDNGKPLSQLTTSRLLL